jgi:hypothetical protein
MARKARNVATRPRGRPPKPPAERKRGIIALRVRDATKERLTAQATANQRSISEEAEMLIETAMSQRATFDQQLELALGREAASLAMLLGLVAGWIGPQSGERHWLSDPYGFEQVKRGLEVVLAAVRPPGEVVEPPAPTGPFAGLAIRSHPAFRADLGRMLAEGAIVQLAGDDRLGVFGDWHDRLREWLAGTPLAQIEAHASAWAGGQANG